MRLLPSAFFPSPTRNIVKLSPVLTQKIHLYEGKQMPQHSIQISRQSDDSQQASMMPQSMSQGQLQSSPISSPQQQQQASEVQTPQEACPRTILQRVRNSQNKHARIQWTQQSSVTGQRRASRGERRDTKYICQPEPGKKLVQVTAQTISSPRLLSRIVS